LQDRTVTGHATYELPPSTSHCDDDPLELGQAPFPAVGSRHGPFAIMVNIGYLPPVKSKLVHFDFKKVRQNPLMTK